MGDRRDSGPPPLVLFHEGDDLLFALGRCGKCEWFLHEGFIEVDLVEL